MGAFMGLEEERPNPGHLVRWLKLQMQRNAWWEWMRRKVSVLVSLVRWLICTSWGIPTQWLRSLIRLVSGGYGKAPNQGDSNADLNNFFFFRLDPCPHVKLNRIKVDWCQIKRCFTLNQSTMSILQFSEIVRFFSVDNIIASGIIEKGENALQSDHLLKFGITKECQIQAIVRRSYVKDPSKAYHLTVSTL